MEDEAIDVKVAGLDTLSAAGLPQDLDRLPAAGMASQGRNLGAIYYTANGDPDGLIPAEFFKAGGVELSYSPVGDEPPVVDTVDEMVPGRFIDVQVAGYKGKLGWGDPDELGNRAHNLIWTANGVNFRVTAVRNPEDIINLTRDYLCR